MADMALIDSSLDSGVDPKTKESDDEGLRKGLDVVTGALEGIRDALGGNGKDRSKMAGSGKDDDAVVATPGVTNTQLAAAGAAVLVGVAAYQFSRR